MTSRTSSSSSSSHFSPLLMPFEPPVSLINGETSGSLSPLSTSTTLSSLPPTFPPTPVVTSPTSLTKP
ncbi:hypothetical protein ACSBR2_015183 [Camellia fascicularis]